MFDVDVLEAMAPGPELHAAVAAVDPSSLTGWGREKLMQARARLVSHLQAQLCSDMVAVAQAVEEEIGFEFAPDEIAAALHWTRRAGDAQLHFARRLIERFPHVWEALQAGEIDLPKAKTIVHGLDALEEDDVARQVADRLLVRASERTTGQIWASLRRYVMQVDPEAAQKRYEKGASERRVELGADIEGTAGLHGLKLPADRANAAMANIDALAKQARVGDDPRTIDQVRADVFLDLLEGKARFADGGRGTVDLVVDLTTLASLSDNPGEVPGFGPIVADVARQIAADQLKAEWRYTVTDPATGQVVHNGITRRRPTAALKRWVQARYRFCVFPGCRRPAINSDLDHRRQWSKGGKTSAGNLEPLCRRHHRVKDEGGWRLQLTPGGHFIWTSPLGLTHTVEPQGP